MKYKDFTDFPVWQKGLSLVLKVYAITKEYPPDERFGLISDMRRASNSITQNIAEGFGREGSKDKSNFYKIARGGAYEIISQTLVSSALGFCKSDDKENIVVACRSIIEELNYIIKYLKEKSNRIPQP